MSPSLSNIGSEHLRSSSFRRVTDSGTRNSDQGGAPDQLRMAGRNETRQNENGNEKAHNGNEADDNESENDETENDNTHTDQETGQEDESTSSVEMKRKRKNALLQFRCRIEDAILGNYLLGKPGKNLSAQESTKAKEQLRDITLWGVPLLPSKGHVGTDVVLLKFLRARDFKVQDAFEMLRKTLRWRKEYKIDGIIEEKLAPDLENFMYFKSRDREGRPLCYIIYGALQDKEILCEQALGAEGKCKEFLRWRVQNMEKGIKKLSFSNGVVDSVVHIVDLKKSLRTGMEEIRSIDKKTMVLIEDNYPEIIHKVILINAPFWSYASHLLRSRFSSQRDKRKYLFVGSSRVTKTLLKFIAPENLPVEYGGLERENDDDFTPADKATELIIGGTSTAYIKFPVTEAGVTMVWDITVVRWDVSYKEEFIPNDECSYKILVRNQKKMGETIRNSFYISEPGRIVITIDNDTFKKKRVFYRSKTKPTIPMYVNRRSSRSSS